MLTAPGTDVARQALMGGYVGIPYSQLDCQGFVEKVLYDVGIRKSDGTPYNWKGSNSMWRNYVTWKGTFDECIAKYGHIPDGAFLFIVKFDGGEEARGYHDGEGNATHVGLYVDPSSSLPAMDSQPTGGVRLRKLSIFNRVALMSMIDYPLPKDPLPQDEPVVPDVLTAVHILRQNTASDEVYLDALRHLTAYLENNPYRKEETP